MFKYFKGKISHGFVSIYSSRMILVVSISLLGMFLPIFLYITYNLNISYVILYYIVADGLHALTVAFGAMFLNRIGLRRSMRISVIFGALHYFCFYLIDQSQASFEFVYNNEIVIISLLSILALTTYRIMYYVPYHTDFAKFTSSTNRGKELSLLEATSILLSAIMPLFAGVLLLRYSFDILFLISMVVYLVSMIPLMTIPRTKEKFSWGYWETWGHFFDKSRRRVILAFMAEGAENIVGTIMWPVFIWLILNGNYFDVGAISSLIVFITFAMQLAVGKYADSGKREKLLRYGSVFYAVGWIFKIFIATAFHIFIVSVYHNFANIFVRTPFNTYYYQISADQGHYIDEFTVLHEMAIESGRVLMYSLLLILFAFGINIQLTFVLAAVISLFLNLIIDKKEIIGSRKRIVHHMA